MDGVVRGAGGDDDRQITGRAGEAGGKVKIIFNFLSSSVIIYQATKTDAFLEKFQTAFDPPHFWKILPRIFLGHIDFARQIYPQHEGNFAI